MAEDATKKTTTNYPGNSNIDREKPAPKQERVVEKAISGEVVRTKKPLGRRIADAFTGDDVHSVGNYVLMDVVVPALKNTLQDVVTQGFERLLFGDSRPRSNSSSGGLRTNYSGVSSNRGLVGSRREDPPARQMSQRARANHDFGDVVIRDRAEAEDVLDRLRFSIEQYDVVAVAELLQLVGITPAFTDDKYGWNDLRHASVRRVRDGYLLDLPRPMPLD